jgi:UDP-glucose 4-epimerase
MKRVIVTGATGFVGANLTRRLLTDGHEIHLLVRERHQSWRIEAVKADVHLHSVEMTDGEALARVVARIRPDWVFHLSAHGAYSWQSDLQGMVRTNILGTINLVEACLKTGFERFVNAGSSSEYGYKDHAPSETERLEPNSYYAVTKASATMFCRYTAQLRGVPLVTLRFYSVYGPYEDPRRLIPTLVVNGRVGRLPPLVNPDVARDFVYVGDAVEACRLAAARPEPAPGAVYNVGTGTQTSIREVTAVACRVMGITVAPQWGSMPDRAWDTSVWVADNRAIRSALGWEPRYGFADGFRETVQWFRDHPELMAVYARNSG